MINSIDNAKYKAYDATNRLIAVKLRRFNGVVLGILLIFRYFAREMF